VYNYRLYNKYRQQMVSQAVLEDEHSQWRLKRSDMSAGAGFPMVKLLNYRAQWDLLEASEDPFATVVMTHLKARESRQDALERKAWKFRLMRRLDEEGYDREAPQKSAHPEGNKRENGDLTSKR